MSYQFQMRMGGILAVILASRETLGQSSFVIRLCAAVRSDRLAAYLQRPKLSVTMSSAYTVLVGALNKLQEMVGNQGRHSASEVAKANYVSSGFTRRIEEEVCVIANLKEFFRSPFSFR
jgi:hypothetical protein